MLPGDPILTVLLYSVLAAATAALGALPFALVPRPPRGWIGAAYSLASGFMLAAVYLLLSRGLESHGLTVVAGTALGIAYSRWVQSYSGLEDLEAEEGSEGGEGGETDTASSEKGYGVILQNALHSSMEGLSIGVAMLQSWRFGIFLALALAVHNIGEAMALTAVLSRRMPLSEAAGLCVVAKVSQPLLAIVAFAVTPALGPLGPAVLGFAAGALLFLVLHELVPAAYRRSDKGQVATLVTVSLGVVVLLADLFA